MSELKFANLADFIVHLAAAEVALHAAGHHSLDKAAALIEKTAKDKFGEYQAGVGAFDAWAPLAESTVADRVSKGFTPDDPLLRTGGLRDSISREVTSTEALIGSTSDVMVYQELGTSKMPPRPVLGPAAYENVEKIVEIIGTGAMEAIEYGAAGAFVPLPKP